MQRLRTNGTLLMFIFGVHIIFIAPSVVKTQKIDESVNNLEKVFRNIHNVVQINDITAKAADDDIKSLITYQSINHLGANSDEKAEDWRLYQIQLDVIGGGDSFLLISTLFEESCQENSTLPAWKIDKRVRNFLVKINHAKRFAGKTFYLCFFDKTAGQFKHLGDESRFSIDDG